MEKRTQMLSQRILAEYAESISLPKRVNYYGGARLRPVVPLDTAVNGVMIIGAYPSARFETVDGMQNVPVGDNLGPFEPERYFDGSRVRTQASADELKRFYLDPLGLAREQCWVTDLVKVFLFKPGHREKYEKLNCEVPFGYERERFEELAAAAIPWIEKEIALAKPKLIITLGTEVAGILRRVSNTKERNALLSGIPTELALGGRTIPTVHLAHPGIVMRKGTTEHNPWPKRHSEEHIPLLRAWVNGICRQDQQRATSIVVE